MKCCGDFLFDFSTAIIVVWRHRRGFEHEVEAGGMEGGVRGGEGRPNENIPRSIAEMEFQL